MILKSSCLKKNVSKVMAKDNVFLQYECIALCNLSLLGLSDNMFGNYYKFNIFALLKYTTFFHINI